MNEAEKDNAGNGPQEVEVESAEESAQADTETSEVERELDAAKAQVAEHKEALLRVRAEMENLRKRNLREVENARKFALERFMGDLLEVRDSLERGLEAAQAGDVTVEQLKEGEELTYRMLVKAMDQHGLVELDPAGEKFDPEKHEAMSMVPTPNAEPDTIVTVVQKGYALNERLIRPARVLVAKQA